MLNLTPAQMQEYLWRSYTAVDGLWFMKVEEAVGFDKALDLDETVWQVMPKIQARKMKQLSGREHGLDDLKDCLETKMAIDQYAWTATRTADALELRITTCPWIDLMAKAGRKHLATTIGDRICPAEFGGWAREFGCAFDFTRPEKLCRDCSACVLRFTAPQPTAD